ncbi:MAG: hypothetical protein AB7F83_11900 [Lysobacterales bacterium]
MDYTYYGHPIIFSLGKNQPIRYSLGEIVFRPNTGEILSADTSIRAKFCSASSKWECVKTDKFFFAVKKNWSVLPPTWRYKNTTFNVVGVETLFILGQAFTTQVICSRNPSVTLGAELNCFNYTPERGLLAIHVSPEVPDGSGFLSEPATGEEITYISSSGYGFGANPPDRKN